MLERRLCVNLCGMRTSISYMFAVGLNVLREYFLTFDFHVLIVPVNFSNLCALGSCVDVLLCLFVFSLSGAFF